MGVLKLTKIAFIQEIAYEHLGTAYLSAVLKKAGHQCNVFVTSLEKNLIDKLKEAKPDLIAFSVITGSHKWCLAMARKIKDEINCKVIFGGPHATHFPEVIKEEAVDYVCRGEGEEAIVELADKLGRGEPTTNISGIWCKKDGEVIRNDVNKLIENIDILPLPDRDAYYKYKKMKNNPQKRFLTTRGCPYNCSFCFNHSLRSLYKNKGVYIRQRSIENVISEMLEVKKRYKMRTVYFEDDTFVLNKKWVIDFLKVYKEKIALPFIVLIRANLVDEEIIKAFKESGCKSAFFGIETGNEELRNLLLKKNLSNKDIIEAARLLHKYKIKFKTYNMLGLPDETLDNAFETLELNAKIKTTFPWCSIFQPYPGTELGRYAIERGYIGANFDCDDIQPYFFMTSVMHNKKDINKIINLQKLFVLGVKFPFTIPLIKKLVKLPPNFMYSLIFLFGYAYTYLGSEDVSILNRFGEGLETIRKFIINQ